LGDSNTVCTLYLYLIVLFGFTKIVLHSSTHWWKKSMLLLQEQQLN
jgi:hypothetical protein